ncbi:AMP-binding protein [Chelativorans sp. ZYF759]|uniref:AMP-binding protein n=1 Tax=Chelativorans sp. ZYF759 TaxID=2692213 RepID=UPI0034D79C82
MVWALSCLAGVACLWAVAAGYLAFRLRISFRQALLYAPVKAVFIIRNDGPLPLAKGRGTIYVVSHRSRLDPAVMLSLLPADTLHILDHDTAKSWWMEPYRDLARTIPFNATHVFVSRRLVRLLRGNGSIAVYLPDDAEPDTRAFRLFRAVGRIALKADAAIVPIRLGAPGGAVSDRSRRAPIRAWPRPGLALSVVSPATIAELRQRPGETMITASNALFDRVAQTRICDKEHLGTSFMAVARAGRRFGNEHVIHLAGPGQVFTFGEILREARLIADRIARKTQEGDLVGLYLPGSTRLVPAFLATQSAGVGAVLLDNTVGPEVLSRTIQQAPIRKVLTSRQLTDETSQLMLAAMASAGARIQYLEDILDAAGAGHRLVAGLMRHRPVAHPSPDVPAVLLPANDGGGDLLPLSHRRLLASVAQAAARLRLRDARAFVSTLPPTHTVGLTVGMLLPLASGTPFRIQDSGDVDPTILNLDGTVIVLVPVDQAQTVVAAGQNDATHLRVIACRNGKSHAYVALPPLQPGIEILEAFAPAGETGLVTLSSASHRRAGTLGRVLPSLRHRLLHIPGIERGGQLQVSPSGMALPEGIYANDPDRPEASPQGWVDTGTLVSLDREGFIHWLGRADRFATLDGNQRPLSPVEAVAARAWPQSHHLAVAAEDRRKGERIVLLTTQIDADKATLRKLARSLGLEDSLLPSEIITIPALPLGKDGLPDEARAREIVAASVGRSRTKAA